MSITLNKKVSGGFPTEIEITSIISINQKNCSGKNHIVLTIKDIEEIHQLFSEYNKDWYP